MLQPIINILTQLLQQLTTLAPVIIGLAVFAAGAIIALGNHNKGRDLVIAAIVGGVVMLGAQTIASGIHA